MNFAPRILNSDRLNYESKYGIIRQFDPQNQLVRRDDAAEYFPVRYSIPWRNDTAIILNFDVSSEPVRSTAITRAIQTNNITITPRIALAYDLSKGGISVYFPFYGTTNITVVSGLVIGIYELDRTIQSVNNKFDDKSGIGLDIIDLESKTPIY